ncbi:MAG: hypothetical protein M0Z59_10025 [Nitrospiraceae bacterium]|nr:hypothetical protein [Nitrospiraceae bacterium]
MGLLIVALIASNFLHDAAAALLAASGVAMWAAVRHFEADWSPESAAYFSRFHANTTRLARISLYWILIGGIPRVLMFHSYEWAAAVGHSRTDLLIVKLVLVFALAFGGSLIWTKAQRRAVALLSRQPVY